MIQHENESVAALAEEQLKEVAAEWEKHFDADMIAIYGPVTPGRLWQQRTGSAPKAVPALESSRSGRA